jgi:hypothetical protein
MRTIIDRRHPPIDEDPAWYRERILADYKSKRCVVCRFQWPVEMFVVEDGVEKCPLCADHKTEDYKVQQLVNATRRAAKNARKLAKSAKEISQFPLAEVIPGTVNTITRSDGTRISPREPLAIERNTAVTVLLAGTRFASTDTLTYPTGITDSSAVVRTATLTTLTLIAALSMVPGDYNLTFNNSVYRGIFRVR